MVGTHNKMSELKRNYHLIELVYPKYVGTIIQYEEDELLYNPNMYLIVIGEMSLGIIMNASVAHRFGYIKRLEKYDEIVHWNDTKINIVEINENWDTSKWFYTRIRRFHDYLECIEDKTMEEIENDRLRYHRGIDLAFLDSLLWNSELDIECRM